MKTTPKKTPGKARKAPSVTPKTPTGANSPAKPRGKGGAPKGSCNAIRHGLRCGQLPKDAKYIEHRLNAFRRTLETAVMAVRGEVTIPDAANIQTAIRWERHACLAQRWLTKQFDELKPVDRLTFSREIARASGERDKAVAALRLGKAENERAPWLAALPAPEPTDAPAEPANGDESRD